VRVPRFVHAAPGITLWAQAVAGPPTDPVFLVADAGASLALWPEPLIAALAAHHPVICYDHRDTGRSRASRVVDGAADEAAYGAATLAADALAVLDAYDVARSHLLGWGMGGLVAQLLLLDHPERFASATLVATRPLRTPGAPAPSAPPTALRRLWAELDDPRDREGELAWRVAHDRLLHGTAAPFDAAVFRARHERAMAHAGSEEPVTAHTHLAVPSRGAELAAVAVPTLVVEAPEDPVHPPPTAEALAAALGRARLVRVPGLGHVAGDPAAARLAAIVVDHMMSIPKAA
jgi:pimeloyl-ACP methyl ester carboxylesterase